MSRPKALIVDDEEDLRTLMRLALNRIGIDCVTVANLNDAMHALASNKFNFCLTDLNLPDGSGMALLSHIVTSVPQMPTAVITAYGSMDIAVEALKIGAFDFVSKPLEISRLRDLVARALKVDQATGVEENNNAMAEKLMLGKTDIMQQVRATLAKLARSQAPVYIHGESGTGKEVAARLLHLQGPRSNGSFVAVNCGAIPSELMESEFFGHKKGSFTGATEDKQGLFQSAQDGTLFLDEVADLPLAMQVKLLRAIQEKKIRPVGGQQEIPIDVRILSASHKHLDEQVALGRFRQDLYFRINVIEVTLPPLRQRRDDIVLLAHALLEKISEEWGVLPPTLSNAAIECLNHYSFPGNVRELQNILERAVSLCEGKEIEPEHLQLNTAKPDAAELSNHAIITSAYTPATSEQTVTTLPAEGLEQYLENIEKTLVLLALEKSHWNRTAAAKKLGLSFRALRYKLKKLAIETDDGESYDVPPT